MKRSQLDRNRLRRHVALLAGAGLALAVLAVPREARASAGAITLIGSDAGLPNLHVIFIDPSGQPQDFVQSTNGSFASSAISIPIQNNLRFTAIKAVQGLSPSAAELVGLDTQNNLWSTTMNTNGVWSPDGFLEITSNIGVFDALFNTDLDGFVTGQNGPGILITARGASGYTTTLEKVASAYTAPAPVAFSSSTESCTTNETYCRIINNIRSCQPTETVTSSVSIPEPGYTNMALLNAGSTSPLVFLAGVGDSIPCSSSSAPTPEGSILFGNNGPDAMSWLALQYPWSEAPFTFPVAFSDVTLGVGNNGTVQMILLGQDANPYLLWSTGSSWNWYGTQPVGTLPNPHRLPFQKFVAHPGNSSNLQVVGLSGNDPYLIWQDSANGDWSWYGALPYSTTPGSYTDLAMGPGAADTLVVGYTTNSGSVFVNVQDSNGYWQPNAIGPL